MKEDSIDKLKSLLDPCENIPSLSSAVHSHSHSRGDEGGRLVSCGVPQWTSQPRASFGILNEPTNETGWVLRDSRAYP